MFASHPHAAPSQIKTAWNLLEKAHPSLLKTFVLLVLPLSMLPPAMLYYAGTYHGNEFMAGFTDRNWGSVSALFFGAELLTVGLMGFVIRWIARLNGASVNWQNAQLLAFAAPVPLWLSSLSLFVPSFPFVMAVCCAALALACFIIFQGIEALLHIDEDVTAANIAYGIMGIGAIAWALLIVTVIPLG